MMDAGVPGDPNGLTEKLLVEAQASSVFSLNMWSRELEPCFKVPDPIPGNDVYFVDSDPFMSGNQPFSNCKFGNAPPTTCYCYHYFRDGNPIFNIWLEKFVQYKQCANSADGRSGLIQLGPIFSWGRAVPAYLHDVPFDDARMIQAFARLWDDISAVLAQAKFTIPPTNELARRPEWIISIGNEINLYLDNPVALANAGNVDGVDVNTAWEKYEIFYQKASDYVQGLPVDLDGNGMTDPNTSTPQLAWVTFSTTWSSTEELPCTPGWALTHPAAGCPTDHLLSSYLPMLANSTYASYTYYPHPFAFPPGTPGKDANSFRVEVFADLLNMEQVSVAAQPTVGRRLPIVLQEVGYPSSWVDPNSIDAGAYNSDNIADQQEAFVQGAIDALRQYNNKWIPEIEWWLDALLNPPPPPMQGPFEAPRIVSYNAFMLHDFWGEMLGTCPFEKFDPFAPDSGTPTQLGVFLCSLGLRTEAAAEKDAGAGKTPWGTFVDAATQITEPGLDPDRDCP